MYNALSWCLDFSDRKPLITLDCARDTARIDLETEDLELKQEVLPDGLKIDFWREYEGKSTTDELDIGEEQDLRFLDDEEFGWRLQAMAEKTYKKGPDVMNKSKHTQEQYKAAWATQRTLDVFWKHSEPAGQPELHSKDAISPPPVAQPMSSTNTQSSMPECSLTMPCICHQPSVISVSSMEDSIELDVVQPPPIRDSDDDDSALDLESGIEHADDDEAESWEDELDLATKGNLGSVHDWDVLCDQMKTDLKKHSKTMPLSQINQLMILCNFATLHLKGVSHMAASFEIAKQWHYGKGTHFACHVHAWAHHYQIFKQLPHERRGGAKYSRSFLHDESVQSHC
ncbi:hypothetical protein EDD16DRAFT_1715378 [Pisolithus croceorrhizus]|nr:hypothetical protein EDD16DRAFT_1715378 [Pisolithus croceorrhizus]